MKYVLTVFFCFVLLAGVCTAAEKPALESQKDKESYSIGYQFGTGIRTMQDVDLDVVFTAIREAFEGKEPRLSMDEMKKVMVDLRKKAREAEAKRVQEQISKNLADGKAFLEENKKKEGVKVTASGLQYKVVKEGDGPSPKADDMVTVHYRGTFIDGREFDSSYARNKPETFEANGVIKGWTEALQMMKVGSKWQLFVPSELAYGQRGQGSRVPPNSALIFDVELLSIEPKKEEPGMSETPQTPGQEEKK